MAVSSSVYGFEEGGGDSPPTGQTEKLVLPADPD